MPKRTNAPKWADQVWLSYWLEGEQHAKIRQVAMEQGVMTSEIIRKAVDFYLRYALNDSLSKSDSPR